MLQADFTSILQKAISTIKTKKEKNRSKLGKKFYIPFKYVKFRNLGLWLDTFSKKKKVVILFHGSLITSKNDNNGNKTIKFRRKIKKSEFPFFGPFYV